LTVRQNPAGGLELPYGATFAILPREGNHAEVVTIFADGHKAEATRDVTTNDNRRTAAELGYTESADGVAAALLAHELCHSLLSHWMYERQSRVLRHEANADYVPYHERVYEESIVLAFERYLNTGTDSGPLEHVAARKLGLWRGRARDWIARAKEAA
jgi:hypothetical protein